MDPYEDRPWSEAEWERFMQRSENRSARYQELFETLMEHPDRDESIVREMGWDEEAGDVADSEVEAEPWAVTDLEHLDGLDAQESGDHPRDEMAQIPGYTLAFEAGLEVMQALKPHLSETDPEASDERSERLQSALANALIPAAKIAGGHGMGYEDEVLDGHIVCCKRAVEAAETARNDLQSLRDHDQLPAPLADGLISRMNEVRQAIEQRLADLRARVWW